MWRFARRGHYCVAAFASALSDVGSLKVAELTACYALKHEMAQAQTLPKVVLSFTGSSLKHAT